MADAKKCDRCGKYYITNEQEFKGCNLRGRRSNSPSIFFDLCRMLEDCGTFLIIQLRQIKL